MSYLIRVIVPDTPGSLGQLAEALGLVDANIHSVDVVHVFPDGVAMDDIVVSLPAGALPDTLITAAQELDGVEVDSIRPFAGTVDRRGQVTMLAAVAQYRRNETKAMEELVAVIPKTMTSGWGIVLKINEHHASHRVAASVAAPEDDGTSPLVDVPVARALDPETETWIPERWALLDSTLAAAPITGTDLLLVVGRPGGPEFLASEVEHLGHLGDIIGAMLS